MTSSSYKPEGAGFTLIETLIAVTILILAVVGPLYVADRAIVTSQISRDQLVASYLAQEGIEYVRTMRDHEFLAAYHAGGSTVATNAWNAFVVGTGASGGSIASCITTTCTLDPSKPMGTGSGFALASCSGSACGPLYLSSSAYTEQSGSGSVTPFTRTLQATLASTNDMRIVSTVTWTSRGTLYRISVYDHLVPWQ